MNSYWEPVLHVDFGYADLKYLLFVDRKDARKI
jgi:hypothetical protein